MKDKIKFALLIFSILVLFTAICKYRMLFMAFLFILKNVLLVFLITGILLLVWSVYPFKCGNWLYHDIMNKHVPKYDEKTNKHFCKICGKELVQNDYSEEWVVLKKN